MCAAGRWFYFVSLGLGGLALFFLFPLSSAYAANFTYEAVRTGPGQYAPSGVQVPITTNIKGPGVSKFNQMVPVATPSTIGKFARAAVRGGGVGFAVTGIIEGVGYLVDSATGEIQKTEVVTVPGNSIVTSDSRSYSGLESDYCTTNSVYASYQYCIDGPGYAHAWNCNDPNYPIGIETYEYRTLCFGSVSTEEQLVPIDSADIERINNALNDALTLAQKMAILNQVLTNARLSGSVDTDNYPVIITGTTSQQQLFSDWPELKQELERLVNAEISAYLETVQPDFELSPEDQAIVDDSTDVLPPDFTAPELELPAFCEWASWVCQPFIGDDHPDVPTIDLEVEEYDSGLPGNASCPAPYTFETGFTGRMEISFQPACDLASAIRVPLLAISYLMAGFIVVGVRR